MKKEVIFEGANALSVKEIEAMGKDEYEFVIANGKISVVLVPVNPQQLKAVVAADRAKIFRSVCMNMLYLSFIQRLESCVCTPAAWDSFLLSQAQILLYVYYRNSLLKHKL